MHLIISSQFVRRLLVCNSCSLCDCVTHDAVGLFRLSAITPLGERLVDRTSKMINKNLLFLSEEYMVVKRSELINQLTGNSNGLNRQNRKGDRYE